VVCCVGKQPRGTGILMSENSLLTRSQIGIICRTFEPSQGRRQWSGQMDGGYWQSTSRMSGNSKLLSCPSPSYSRVGHLPSKRAPRLIFLESTSRFDITSCCIVTSTTKSRSCFKLPCLGYLDGYPQNAIPTFATECFQDSDHHISWH
jgi:hypothetical protein